MSKSNEHWANYESHASVPAENPVNSRFVTMVIPDGRVDIYETSEDGPKQVSGPYHSAEVAFVALKAMNAHENICGFCNGARPKGSTCPDCGMPDFN